MNMTQYIKKKDVVYQYLKTEIVLGKYPPETRLPNEIDFAKQLGVGKITLRSALDRLSKNGMVLRIPGKGTFVSPENIKSSKTSMILVVHTNSTELEAPHNYIVPEVARFAESKSFKILSTTVDTLLMFSSDDIKNYVMKNNVIAIISIMNDFIGDEPILNKLRNAGVPVIITNCTPEDVENTGFAGIVINAKEGWEAAINYLRECGHRNIGMIGSSHCNFRGFTKQECIELLKKYDASPIEPLLVELNFDRELIKKAVRKMFEGNIKPTVILCYSDFYAIYVYEALKEMNLQIPEDVAVMGNCGYPDAKLLSPPLSTVDYEYSKFAEMAIEMLQEPEKWFSGGKGKLREKAFKIRKRKSTNIKITN